MKVLQFLKVNLSALFVLLSLAVFSTGCNDEDAATVSVSKEIVLVGSDAQAIPVTIMSNANWTAESNASWVRVSKASGRGTTDIEVLIEACTAVADRSAMISVRAGGKTAIIDVTQNATAGLLILAPDSMSLGNQGGIVSFVIASNSPWTISSSNEWAVPSATSGNGNATINVSVASNESHFVPRQATLSVTTGTGTNAIVRTFTVGQLSRALPHITVAQKAVTFAANAKSARQNVVLIPIVSNVTGAITAHTDFNWYTVSVETIQGVKYVRIVCESDNNDNNNRDCIVNVIANVDGEATTAQIRVTQAGLGSPDIVLFRNNVALDCNAAALVPVNYYFPTGKNISVKAVSEEPKWITNVKVDAAKKRVTFDVSANLTGETRVGTIMVTASIGTETQLYPITVTQAGVGEADVTVAPAALNLGALINLSATATVTSQTAYTGIAAVATDASWLTVEQLNETSNGASYAQDIKVTATPNALSGSRTATVTLTVRYGDKLVLRTISVTQAGLGSPYITLLPSEVNVSSAAHNAEGDDIVITYLAPSNVSFDAVSTTDWLKVHGIYENLNKIVLRIPTENKDEADRTGIVNVSVTRDGETVVYPVKVTQRGLGAIDVRISPEVITLSASTHIYTRFVVSAQYADAVISANVTSGEEWFLTGNQPHLIDTDKNGNSLTHIYHFSVRANNDAEPRVATIEVTTEWGNKKDVRTVTVVQNGLGAPAVSTASNAYLLSNQTEHSQSLWLEDGNTSNVNYQVTSVSYHNGINNQPNQVGWITSAVVRNNQLVITTTESTHVEAREGEVTIVASRGTSKAVLTVHVTQAGSGSTYAYIEEAQGHTVYVDDLRKTAIGEGTFKASGASSTSHVFTLANLPAGATVNVGKPTAVGSNPAVNYVSLTCNDGHDDEMGSCTTTITATASNTYGSGEDLESTTSILVNIGFAYSTRNAVRNHQSTDHVYYPTGTFTVPVTIITANYTQIIELAVNVLRKAPYVNP